MAASTNDKITDTRNSARPNTASVSSPRSAGGTSLSCDDLTGWPTASKVHFVTYAVDSSNEPVTGSQLDCSGIVSGNSITSLTVLDGTDTGNSVGDKVEMLPTASWGQDLADAVTKEHDRTGSHTSAAIATIGAALYPVGSYYINETNSANPSSLLGFGTWTQVKDKMIMAAGDTYAAGAQGGSATHSHTLSTAGGAKFALDSNNTWVKLDGPGGSWTAGNAQSGVSWGASSQSKSSSIGLVGNTDSANGLPPYITAYVWKRIA